MRVFDEKKLVKAVSFFARLFTLNSNEFGVFILSLVFRFRLDDAHKRDEREAAASYCSVVVLGSQLDTILLCQFVEIR